MARLGTPGFNLNSLAYVDSRLSNVPVVEGPRIPTVNDKNYPLWTEWRVGKGAPSPAEEGDFWKLVRFESNGDATWIKFNESSTGPLITLSDTANTKVEGDVDGNIRNYSSDGSVSIIADPSNNQFDITLPDGPETALSNYIVEPSGLKADWTTIQAAINAANAAGGGTVGIKPGNYTEDLTLYVGVNLVALTSSYENPSVEIIGTATLATGDGTVNIENIKLTTNGNYAVVNSGTGASYVKLNNCYVNAADSDFIHYTNSNANSGVFLNNCIGNIAATYTLFVATGVGTSFFGSIQVHNSSITSSSTTVASTSSASQIIIVGSKLDLPLSVSSTGTLYIQNSTIDCSAQNTTPIILTGTGTSTISSSTLSSGTAQTISFGATNTLNLHDCVINSTNAAIVSGTGTLNTSLCTFPTAVNGTSVCITSSTFNDQTLGPRLRLADTKSGSSVLQTIYNYSSTAGSSAVLQLLTGGLTSGDPYIKFSNGNDDYNIGIDTSDRIFKITSGSAGGPSSGTDKMRLTLTDVNFPITGSLKVPSGDNSSRPSTPANGMMRYNTDLGYIEGYSGGSWKNLTNSSEAQFLARVTSTVANVTGDGSGYTVIFGTEVYDTYPSYDHTTGIFTAPVTGKYFFSAYVILDNVTAAHTTLQLSFVATSRTITGSQIAGIPDALGRQVIHLTMPIDMTAADQIYVLASVGGSTKTVGVIGSTVRSYFGGYLIS